MSAKVEDLKNLTKFAQANGASKASAILAASVVLDPRVELKCRVPLCPHFGRCLTCPPNVIGPEKFRNILDRYAHALLVQKRYGKDDLRSENVTRFQDLEESPEYMTSMHAHFKDFADLMGAIESEAMKMGYRFSAAFAGGPCSYCQECAGPGQPCRHPFRARPSMEAMGIDVIATASSAQMPIELPAKDFITLTGLLLID